MLLLVVVVVVVMVMVVVVVVMVVTERFKVEQSTAEKGNLRPALSCTREPYLLRK